MAKLVAWHRRYARFWKQSALYCDFRWPEFFNTRNEDNQGMIGEGEPKFLGAVTGNKLNFADGMEIGRKIWNLDNAIWTLQGRHRDMVHFPEYIYRVPYARYGAKGKFAHYHLPGRENGKWSYIRADGRHLDKSRFDEWKTIYYELEGWDPTTGWPRKKTLAAQGLGNVNDELAHQDDTISKPAQPLPLKSKVKNH
jgi:aldehyde:ferredoxin oxidoreductase